MTPARVLEAKKASSETITGSKQHLIGNNGETLLCKVLIVADDRRISDILEASSQLELTHSSPTDFQQHGAPDHQDAFIQDAFIQDAFIIDTSLLEQLNDINFSTFSQPIIFVQTEAKENHEFNFDAYTHLTLSELTVNKILRYISQNLEQASTQANDHSPHQQTIEANQLKLTTLIQDLQENQSFLTEVLDQIPSPVFVKDDQLRFLAYNKAFADAYLKEASWIGKTLLDVEQSVYKNPKAVHEGQFKLLAENSSYSQEYHVTTNNEDELDVLGTVTAFTFSKGQKQGLIGIVQDITHLKATERKLAESLEYTEDINSKLERLNQLSLDLVNLKSLDDILDIVCKQTKILLESDRTSVILISDASIPTQVYIHDQNNTGYKAFNVATMDKVLAIMNQVITSKQCVSFSKDKINKDSRLGQKGYSSFIASPIIVDGKVIATLNAASLSSEAYSTNAERWLQQITSLVSIALQKQALLEQTQAALNSTEIQAQRLSGLSSLSEKLMIAPDHETIGKIVLNELPQLINAYAAYLGLLTQNNDHVKTFQINEDGSQFQETGRSWPIKDVILGQAISQRKIIRLNFEDSTFPDSIFIFKEGFRSGMVAPLMVEGKVLGALSVVSEQADAFTVQDEAFMLQVASLTAATLENKRLFEEKHIALNATELQAKRLVGLNKLTKELMIAPNHETICNIVLNELPNLISSHKISFAFPSANATFIETYVNSEDGKHLQYTGNDWSIENSVLAKVLAQRKIVRMNFEGSNDANILRHFKTGLRSGMSAPLIIENKVLGAINLASADLNAYTEQDEGFMLQVASLTAATLENKRLFEENHNALNASEIQAKRLTGLNKLTKELMVAPSHEIICNMVLKELPKLIKSDFTTFSFFSEDNTSLKTYENSADGKYFQATGRVWQIENVSLGEAISQRRIIQTDFETSNYLDAALAFGYGMRSGMVAPLILEDKILGTINVASKDAQAFTEQDEAFMLQVASLAAATIENKKLFEESQQSLQKLTVSEENFRTLYDVEERKTNELKLIDRVQKAIATKQTLEKIFDTVIATLRELIAYRSFAFSRIRDGRTYHKKSQACCYPSKYDDYSTPINRGILGRAVRTGEAILVKDVRQDHDYIALFDDVVSNIAVPVYDDTIIIGVLMVEHTRPLDESDLSLMVKISEQLSIAIENANLHQQTQTALTATEVQAKRLLGLNKLTKELMNAPSHEVVCNMVLTELPKLIASKTISFSFLSADETFIESYIKSKDGLHLRSTGYKWPINNSALGKVVTGRKIIRENFEDSHDPRILEGLKRGLRSGMSAPLIVEDRVLGTINLTSTDLNAYTEQDEGFLLQVASLAAVAIENKRLFEESQQNLVKLRTSEQELRSLYFAEQQRANELMAFGRVQRTIADKLGLDQIFETAVKAIAESLDYKAVEFREIVGDKFDYNPHWSYGYPNILERTQLTIDQGIMGLAATSKKAILVEDVSTNPAYVMAFDGVISNISIPVFRNSKLFGILVIEDIRRLSKSDLNILEQIGEQLSIALENVTLHAQVLTDLKQKEALFNISQLLRSTKSVLASTEDVMEILAKALDARWLFRHSTASVKDASKPMPFIADYANNLAIKNALLTDYLPTYTKREGTLAYKCISTQMPILLTKDNLKSESKTVKDALESKGAASTMIVPIYDNVNKDTIIGTLGVTREEHKNDFSQSDLNFLVSVSHQISMAQSQNELSKQVEFQAFHDRLTGLPNRNLFEQRLNQEMAFASEQNTCVGLLFLDLDSFKYINDTFGHEIGDQLLKLVGKRLGSTTRYTDTLARMGGDEFSIVLSDLDSLDQGIEIATDYLRVFEKPFDLAGNSIIITASIGLSIFPEDGQSVLALLKHADIAMYLAKAQGKNGIQIFSAELADKAKERLLLENNLRLAIDNKEFILHYQPQYCLNTRELIGAEALIRWNHPQDGLISPNRFIPVAEETLLIIAMGQWALNQACQQTALWHKQGQKITVAVNVAAAQFLQPNFVETVTKSLETNQLGAQYLELEVTESVVMDNIELVANKLQDLRDLGVSIALDDFGTGFSSLQYLQNLPFDKLKIDKSFIMKIGTGINDNRDKVLVKNIIQLATGFELKVVAEGIETLQQESYLKELGCQYVQGFYYAKPVVASEVFKQGNLSSELNALAAPSVEGIPPSTN